jgi:cobalt-zinc-cadmium efflux system membrane fusion protein
MSYRVRVRLLPRIGPVLGLALALSGVDACKPKVEPTVGPKAAEGVDVSLDDKALEAAHVTTAKVASARRRSQVTVTGIVDFVPSRVARIGPSIPGRVSQIVVAPGQDVGKGAVVAILESVDVGRARADLMSARSRLDMAEAEVAREERLVAGGASSERSLERAKTERSLAQTELRAAEARLSTLGAGGGGGATTVPLTSPLAGRVLEIKARIGQPVGPTDTLVVVGETREVWLAVDVYERDLAKVHVGDDVRVTTIAFPKRVFTGRVDNVGAVVDSERRVVAARIVLANDDGALRPGMTSTARILGELEGDGGTVLSVPRGAVQSIDGQPFVFVEKERGKYELRAIERGADLEDGVEVLRGLASGETIVDGGSFILKSEVLREQMGAND